MSTLRRLPVITVGADLAAAIAAAAPGAVLVLAPGRHVVAGALVIDRPLALLAEGDATLVAPVVELRAAGWVVLRDLAVEGAVRVVGSTIAELRDVFVRDARGPGIAFLDASTGEARGCLVERCAGPGLLAAGRATPLVEGCMLIANAGPGLEWSDAAGGEAYGNLCQANAVGIRVAGDATPALAHNTARGNRGDAVVYLDAARRYVV